MKKTTASKTKKKSIAKSTATFVIGQLGTTTDSEGTTSYQALRNPLLVGGVIGINDNGSSNPMNPNTFAQGLVADAIAGALGGEVVNDPQAENWKVFRIQVTDDGQWSTLVPVRVLAVQIPDRLGPMNAGYICDILGNDVAYGSARMKSWEICSILDLPFDPSMADTLYRAVMANGK